MSTWLRYVFLLVDVTSSYNTYSDYRILLDYNSDGKLAFNREENEVLVRINATL